MIAPGKGKFSGIDRPGTWLVSNNVLANKDGAALMPAAVNRGFGWFLEMSGKVSASAACRIGLG